VTTAPDDGVVGVPPHAIASAALTAAIDNDVTFIGCSSRPNSVVLSAAGVRFVAHGLRFKHDVLNTIHWTIVLPTSASLTPLTHTAGDAAE